MKLGFLDYVSLIAAYNVGLCANQDITKWVNMFKLIKVQLEKICSSEKPINGSKLFRK